MNGNELLKRLKKLVREKQVRLEVIKAHGKGSHSTLRFGSNKTIIKDLKKEIGPGLLKKMLDQLGVEKSEI
jgi:predicted DNA-binding protein with PD1-like motif